MKTLNLLSTFAAASAILELAFLPCRAFSQTATPRASAPNKAQVHLTVTSSEGGKVVGLPSQETLSANTVVQLTAQAEDGYVFMGWSGDVERMKNPLTISVGRSMTIRATFAAAGVGVIMDNTDAIFEGDWSTSKIGPGQRRDDYRYAGTRSGTPTAWATFVPNLPRRGVYDVYAWYPAGKNRTTNAVWAVQHKNGVTETSVNQKENGSQWVPIALGVEFDSGTAGQARLSNSCGEQATGTVIIADAVAFVFICDSDDASTSASVELPAAKFDGLAQTQAENP